MSVGLNKFKNFLPKIYNIDKYTELGIHILYGKILDSGIYIKGKEVEFREGVIQKYNNVKSFVTKITNKQKEIIADKLNKVNQFFAEKKEIISKKSEGKTTKEAMEEVYGDNKINHLDYRIVNRVANFKENTCQKIKTTSRNICKVSNYVCDTIAKPFEYLRENARDDIKRSELKAKIEEVRKQNMAKKKVLTTSNRAGYIGTTVLLTISVLILSIIIFLGIKGILGR